MRHGAAEKLETFLLLKFPDSRPRDATLPQPTTITPREALIGIPDKEPKIRSMRRIIIRHPSSVLYQRACTPRIALRALLLVGGERENSSANRHPRAIFDAAALMYAFPCIFERES